jgi:hypothetical protein
MSGMLDWEMEKVHEDLLGNPYNIQDAYATMVFPVSPLSKNGKDRVTMARTNCSL